MASLDLGFDDCIAWPMQKLERIWTVQALSFFACMQASSSSNKIQTRWLEKRRPIFSCHAYAVQSAGAIYRSALKGPVRGYTNVLFLFGNNCPIVD